MKVSFTTQEQQFAGGRSIIEIHGLGKSICRPVPNADQKNMVIQQTQAHIIIQRIRGIVMSRKIAFEYYPTTTLSKIRTCQELLRHIDSVQSMRAKNIYQFIVGHQSNLRSILYRSNGQKTNQEVDSIIEFASNQLNLP